MRWGTAVWVLALAACGETAAVKFVVDTSADPDIAEVRLYLGIGHGRDLALSPKGFEPQSPARQGTVYEQDVDGVIDSMQTNGATSVSFVYTAEGVEKLTAIAVGFDAQGVATSQAAAFEIEMPTDHVVVWNLSLAPASAASPTATGAQVQVWGAEDGMQTCVHAVNPASAHEIAYVVASKHDKDCDGYQDGEPLECDDLFYRAHPTTRTEVNCLTDVQIPIVAGPPAITACSLGTSACIDGSELGRDTCITSPRYCVPDNTCTRCETLECALSTWEETQTDVHHCTIELSRDPMDRLVPCQTTIEVPPLHPQLSCPAPAPRYRGSDASNTTWSAVADASGVRLSFSSLGSTCKTLVAPSLAPGAPGGEIDPNAEGFGGLLDLTASTGNHIVMPVEFELVIVSECSSTVVVCQRQSISLMQGQPTCVDPSIPPDPVPL